MSMLELFTPDLKQNVCDGVRKAVTNQEIAEKIVAEYVRVRDWKIEQQIFDYIQIYPTKFTWKFIETFKGDEFDVENRKIDLAKEMRLPCCNLKAVETN